jgi:hypothetical protein
MVSFAYGWFSYYIRQRWDRISTRVHAVRRIWAPVATSHHARHLMLPLPKALGLPMLIHYWKHPDTFDQRPKHYPGSRRELGQVDRW